MDSPDPSKTLSIAGTVLSIYPGPRQPGPDYIRLDKMCKAARIFTHANTDAVRMCGCSILVHVTEEIREVCSLGLCPV